MSTLSFDPDYLATIMAEEDIPLVKENVDHPNHYQGDKYETIDMISEIVKDYGGEIAFDIGNVVKYVSRAPKKNGLEDLKKARWYLDRAIEQYET